jgi:hypothetical protein
VRRFLVPEVEESQVGLFGAERVRAGRNISSGLACPNCSATQRTL